MLLAYSGVQSKKLTVMLKQLKKHFQDGEVSGGSSKSEKPFFFGGGVGGDTTGTPHHAER